MYTMILITMTCVPLFALFKDFPTKQSTLNTLCLVNLFDIELNWLAIKSNWK